MKLRLLVIMLIGVFVNIIPVIASELNSQFNMSYIIEIDKVLSKNKARNTTNPNVIEVEQSNDVYIHFIQDCYVIFIDDKVSIELYKSAKQQIDAKTLIHFPGGNFHKTKYTLQFYPFIEKDFRVEFNCTSYPLTIKSLSPSEFNKREVNPQEIIAQLNKSFKKEIDKLHDETRKSSEQLETLTNWTKEQDEKAKIEECKKKWKLSIRIVEFLYPIIIPLLVIMGLKNYTSKIKTHLSKWIKNNKRRFIIGCLIITGIYIILVWYFEFSKNPFFC